LCFLGKRQQSNPLAFGWQPPHQRNHLLVTQLQGAHGLYHITDGVLSAGQDWGGESGPGARPMHPAWVLEIRDRCLNAGVPFFFKQWGGPRKKKAGRELDGRTWDEVPAGRYQFWPNTSNQLLRGGRAGS
jgi:hypothetical protein